MSKFFNETMKVRNPIAPEQVFDFPRLEEIETVVVPETDSKAAESVPIPAQVGESRKISIPESALLLARFQGSNSLQSLEEAFRALRTRLLRICSARHLRSIIVTSAVPGEGKTLTALNLAMCCSQLHDMRVLLIDGDIRTGELTHSLGLPPSPGLAEVLSGGCDRESAVKETNHANLFVCSSGSTTLPPAELYAGNRWQEFVQWCRESFNLVVIDSPPIMSLSDVELMTAACDGVLMVVRAGHTRRDVLQKSASQIDAKKLLGAVYNFSEGSHHKYAHKYYYASQRLSKGASFPRKAALWPPFG
jgi:protein-tyrosine kinase